MDTAYIATLYRKFDAMQSSTEVDPRHSIIVSRRYDGAVAKSNFGCKYGGEHYVHHESIFGRLGEKPYHDAMEDSRASRLVDSNTKIPFHRVGL